MTINRHFKTFFILFLTLSSIQTTTAQPGSTDLTFNPGNGANGDVQCVCSQSDNKTIVTGLFNDFNGSIVNYIVRLNEDGTIDGSFNTGSGFGGNGTLFSEATYSCAIQSDGKILVGGNFYSFNGTPTNRLVRLNSDGTIDPSFNIGNGFDGSVRSISIQSDGKIIVGGWSLNVNGNSSARLARLNSDGSYDPTFTIGSGFGSLVLATAIQLDGKILVGGQFTTFNGTSQNYIARLNSNGTIDPSFQVGTAFNNYVRAISIQSDGKILTGGDFTTYNGSTTNRIVRLNSNGSIDVTFSAGTGYNNRVYAIEQQTDGQIIVGGQFTTYNGTTRNRIARLNTDGTLDSGFSPTTGFNNVVFTLDMQSDGKIMAGGQFQALNNNSRVRVARLNGTCATLAPTATVAQTFCNSATIANLTATGSGIQWYEASTGGTALTSGTALTTGTIYYASQSISGCESANRLEVTVTINTPASPAGTIAQSFCGTAALADFIVTGANITWYDAASAGNTLVSGTALVDGVTYFASQTVNGCESINRLAVSATVNAIPAAPTATASQGFCNGATVANLAVTGSSVQWYTAASGGIALSTGTSLASGSYFASQTINGCESTDRFEVIVTVTDPAAPTGMPNQNFCFSGTVADLQVNGQNIQWYNPLIGGGTTPLNPGDALVDGFAYQATQTVAGCESQNQFVVTVDIITFSNGVNLNGATLTAAATGGTYQWIDCDGNNAAINGATAQTFTPAQNGNYAVVISVNGCSDTSACVAITTVGLDDIKTELFRVYPNPASTVINVEMENVSTVRLFDVSCKLLKEVNGASIYMIDITDLTPGMYMIESADGAKAKFIRE